MASQTPPDPFTNSAFLAYLHSVVPSQDTQPLIAQMLAILGEPDPAVAEALASIAMRRESYFDLVLWAKRLEPTLGGTALERRPSSFGPHKPLSPRCCVRPFLIPTKPIRTA